MALRSDWSEEPCPVRRSLDVLGDPWVLLIVRNVLHGHGRFDSLRDDLGISEAVLSRRLRTMVEADLLTRVEYDDAGRTRLGYAATQAGADLLPVLQQLALWGERHQPLPGDGARMTLVHEACGAETTTAERCSACGEQLRPEEMAWDKSWHARPDQLVGAGVVSPRRRPDLT